MGKQYDDNGPGEHPALLAARHKPYPYVQAEAMRRLYGDGRLYGNGRLYGDGGEAPDGSEADEGAQIGEGSGALANEWQDAPSIVMARQAVTGREPGALAMQPEARPVDLGPDTMVNYTEDDFDDIEPDDTLRNTVFENTPGGVSADTHGPNDRGDRGAHGGRRRSH